MVVRARLFLSSYCALFAILAIRFEPTWLIATCAALSLVGLLDTAWILSASRRKLSSYSAPLKSVQDAGGEVSGYLASYLLPFVVAPEPTGKDLAAYSVFLLVAGVIYVRSDLVRINPTLYLLGYRVFTVNGGGHGPDVLIGRHKPGPGQTPSVVDVAGAMLMVTGEEDAQERGVVKP